MTMIALRLTVVFLALTNNTHGMQNGRLGSEMVNMSCTLVVTLFSLKDFDRVPIMTFRGLYTEDLHRIGDISGSNGLEGQLVFDNCNFGFRHNGEAVTPGNILSGGFGEIVFRGGQFRLYRDCLCFNVNHLRIEGTQMVPEDGGATLKDYMKIFQNATQGGIVQQKDTGANFFCAARFQRWNLGTGALRGQSYTMGGNHVYSGRDDLLPIWAPPGLRGSDTRGVVYSPVKNPKTQTIDDASAVWSSTGQDEREITFTTSAPSNDQEFNQGGYMPGDFVIDESTGAVAVIRSTNTGTGAIEAELVTNITANDGVTPFSNIVTLDLTTGNKHLKLARVFTPPRRITGTIGTGVATISSIVKHRGGAPTDYGLVANDWLYEDGMNEDTFPTSDRAKIASITTASDLITMTGNAAQAATLVFDFWIKTAPSNEVSR